jgi:hypothetical protein
MNPFRNANPGMILLAAFMFEHEPKKKLLLLELYQDVTARYQTSRRRLVPGTLSYLFRDVLDKADYHKLAGLRATFEPLFSWAKEYDLRALEELAAKEAGRFVERWSLDDDTCRRLKDSGVAQEGFSPGQVYLWWEEKDDRRVRACL